MQQSEQEEKDRFPDPATPGPRGGQILGILRK